MEAVSQVSPPTNIIKYIVSAIVVLLLGLLAIFGVFLVRPDKDNSAIITIIIGVITPTSVTILAFLKSSDTHLTVNSLFDKVMEAAKALARQEAVAEERQSVKDRLAASVTTPEIVLEEVPVVIPKVTATVVKK